MKRNQSKRELAIVGLGPGNPDDLSVGALRALQDAEFVILRTGIHPTTSFLDSEGISYVTCDDIYDTSPDYETVYGRIVERVLEAATSGVSVAYAVPGHPSVFEATTPLLIERCEQLGISWKIVGSQSFLDPLFVKLKIDPSSGLQIVDALRIDYQPLNTAMPAIIAQVYDQDIASAVKLALSGQFGDDYEVVVCRGAGVPGIERIERIRVLEIDRLPWLDHLTSVYVPPAASGTEHNSCLEQSTQDCEYPLDPLVEVVAELRGEHGCPWDKEQDHKSLRPYVLEEAYEVIEAIELGEMHKLCEELGDLLLQIALHSQIATEHGAFDINDVVTGITEKMIRRHPHVFSGATAKTSEEVLERWQVIKQAEKGEPESSLLGDVPMHLPALMQAYKVQHRASKVGFDWKDATGVFLKVLEEVDELKSSVEKQESALFAAEVGDLLFAVVNLSRHLSVNPEVALATAVQKFARRFNFIEQAARSSGRLLKEMSLEEMDALWDEAKKSGL